MTRENPYKDIEIEIRKQLAFAIEADIWESKTSQGSLNCEICKSTREQSLAKVKELSKEMPPDYQSFPELTKMCAELI